MATEEKHAEPLNEGDENPPEIPIDLSDPSTFEFKRAFGEHYQKFCESLVQEYLKIKSAYTESFNAQFESIHKAHTDEYEERNQQITTLNEEFQAKQRRMDHLLTAVENFTALKYHRILLRKLLDGWREKHSRKHRIQARRIYADNHAKRRLAHKGFLGWRKQTHVERKRVIEQEFAFKVEEVKTGTIAVYDKKIREMLAKIEAAKRILAEEIAVKEKLTLQYENALGRGVDVLSRETQVISSNPLITELSFVQPTRSVQEGVVPSVTQTPARYKLP